MEEAAAAATKKSAETAALQKHSATQIWRIWKVPQKKAEKFAKSGHFLGKIWDFPQKSPPTPSQPPQPVLNPQNLTKFLNIVVV